MPGAMSLAAQSETTKTTRFSDFWELKKTLATPWIVSIALCRCCAQLYPDGSPLGGTAAVLRGIRIRI
jgi:hypothetical protein